MSRCVNLSHTLHLFRRWRRKMFVFRILCSSPILLQLNLSMGLFPITLTPECLQQNGEPPPDLLIALRLAHRRYTLPRGFNK